MTAFDAPLAHANDLTAWRAHIRQALHHGISPENMGWRIAPPSDLYAPAAQRDLPPDPTHLRLTRLTAQTLLLAFHAPDPARYTQLHRALLDLDTALTVLAPLAAEGRRAIATCRAALDPDPRRKTRAFYTTQPPELLRAQSHFLTQRLSGPWSILSPDASMLWDGRTLRHGPGAPPDAETAIPAALQSLAESLCTAGPENAYWADLPNPVLPLTRETLERRSTLAGLQAFAPDCRACELWEPASRMVFGEGPQTARLMFVGEQPGDQEDLAGRPFVGPAGQLLDQCLTHAGIDRAGIYITNAVKHFRFTPRGGRRIHAKPDVAHIQACAPWLASERRLIRPDVLVMLGASAAQAILGRPITISRERSQALPLTDGATGFVTVHPSYLLRLPEQDRARETERFIADLQLAASHGKSTHPLDPHSSAP